VGGFVLKYAIISPDQCFINFITIKTLRHNNLERLSWKDFKVLSIITGKTKEPSFLSSQRRVSKGAANIGHSANTLAYFAGVSLTSKTTASTKG
jgi:hypothetical protein